MLNERFTDAAANALWSRTEVVWGLFSVPDRLLGVLGDVADLHVVELACGTAYFSAWLTAAGAKTVALDLSGEQLATARGLQRRLGPVFPLVQADAERVPLSSGASTWWSASTEPPHGVTRSAGCRRLPTAASRRASGLPDQQPAVGAVRPDRRGVRRGTARARPARCLQGALAGRRSRVPPFLTGTGCGCSAGSVSSSRPCTRSTPQRIPATTLSTRSCRPNGQLAGQPRSCGWHTFDSG